MARLAYEHPDGDTRFIEIDHWRGMADGGISYSSTSGGNILLGPAVPFVVIERDNDES